MLQIENRVDARSLAASLAVLVLPALLADCGQTVSPRRTDAESPPLAAAGPPVDALTPLVTTEGNGRVNTTLQGSQVILEAMADPGWMFAGWTGIVSTANPVTIFPGAQGMIGARFVPVPDLSSDGDGVPDDVDLCPGTRPGATVDAFGCSAAQRDSDGDGITDDFDQCPGTPLGVLTNAVGCAANQLDEDFDGVTNDQDFCGSTPFRDHVNALGCSTAQFDSDGDGVPNMFDQCPNTDPAMTADIDGCSQDQLTPPQPGAPPNGGPPPAAAMAWSVPRLLPDTIGPTPDQFLSTTFELDDSGTLIAAYFTPNTAVLQVVLAGEVIPLNARVPLAERTPIYQVNNLGGVRGDTLVVSVEIARFITDIQPGRVVLWTFCPRLVEERIIRGELSANQCYMDLHYQGIANEDASEVMWTSLSGHLHCSDSEAGLPTAPAEPWTRITSLYVGLAGASSESP